MTEQQKETKVFARQSTGLVKNVSIFDAVSLNIGSMSAGAAMATIAFTMILIPQSWWSGLNLVYGSIIAFLIVIPQMIVYTMLTKRLPRTGGDYVWVSRSLGGFVGSVSSFMGYTMETMAFMALIAISAVFAIGSVGVSLGNSNYLNLAVPGLSQMAELDQFAVGGIIFAALIAVNILKPKYGYKLVSATMIIGIITLVTANVVLLSAGNQGVVSFFNSLNIQGSSYSQVASSYPSQTFNLGNTLLLMPFFAMFVYPWFVAAPAVASEIKGKRAINWSVPLSGIISLILVTGSFATLYFVGGYQFINGALVNSNIVNNYSFNFWTLAMGVSPNNYVATFIGLGWILWNIGILAYGIIGVSRYIFAQSFDRFLPEKFSYVSQKFGSPVVAHLIDLVVTITLVGFGIYYYGGGGTTGVSNLYGAIMASMIYFVIVGLAAVVYARRREKGSASQILTICGILTMAVFAYLTYEFLAYPAVWGGNNLAYGYIALSVVLGAIIYLVSKSYHRTRGVDISLAYKEIPPD